MVRRYLLDEIPLCIIESSLYAAIRVMGTDFAAISIIAGIFLRAAFPAQIAHQVKFCRIRVPQRIGIADDMVKAVIAEADK